MEVAGKARVWEAFPCISEAPTNSLQDAEGLTGQEGRQRCWETHTQVETQGEGRKGLRGLGWGSAGGQSLGFVRTHGCGGILSSFLIKEEEREKARPSASQFQN